MIHILSDSTCDLSEELIEKYRITILPLHILLENDQYEDGVNITPDRIYRWANENKTTPKTAAPSVEEAKQPLEKLVQNGDEVIAFSIASGMSASGNVIRMAAENMGVSERVRVIDSQNLSTGIGLLVIKAAELAKEGKSAAEIEAQITALRPKVRASFVVDTLTYLHRGGRCSGVAAFAGSMLKLHPIIMVKDGAMIPGKKYRGHLKKVILDYAKDLEPQLKNAIPDRVFITHSGTDGREGCTPEIVEEVRRYLNGLGIFSEILETRAGGVVSSHCGPGTLGVLFIEK